MLTLHALRLFVAVAQELHFGRAAVRLHMAQPPLSQQIRQLEASLGTPLFTRTTRTVQLTLAGRILLERADRLLEDVQAAEHAVRRVALGQVGTVALGFTSSAAYRVLPKILSAWRAGFPEVDTVLHEMTTDVQLAALLAGKLDVAIIRADRGVTDAAIDSFELEREPMLLAMRQDHPLMRYEAVPVRELDGLEMVGFSAKSSPYFRSLGARVLLSAGVQPTIGQESVLPTLLALVEAGVGAALVPASASEMRASQVGYRPLEPIRDTRAGPIEAILHCVWRRDVDNPAALAMVHLLRGFVQP